MGRVGDPDLSAADFGDVLSSGHVRADWHERGAGVSVVHVAPAERAAADFQDRSIRSEAGDALGDDRPWGDRDLDDARAARVSDGADVDPLIERPVARRE